MPNPHYQRVLEQDRTLPAPLRWLSRAMSSWWTILVLGGGIISYVAAAHIPISGRYIWQWRLFETTQQAVLTWWPLLGAAWLLAAVILWSAMRRLPWRLDNLGAFVAVLGLAIILVSQSWAFHSQTVGVAAVPTTPSTGDTQADALALNYTTRYGDTHDRVLVLMARGGAPITIPLKGLPRWNNASGEQMPKLKIHDHPKLAAVIGFGTRITTTAYLADGTLTETDDGKQRAEPTPASSRDQTSLPYPAQALLAIQITTDAEDGGTQTTTAWLPFEPEGADGLTPKRFFEIEGLGSVGLAFRPASKKLPFALGASTSTFTNKARLRLSVADSDASGRLLQPTDYDFGVLAQYPTHQARDNQGKLHTYALRPIGKTGQDDEYTLFAITTGQSNPFILVGLATFILGGLLDRGLALIGALKKYGNEPLAASPTKG